MNTLLPSCNRERADVGGAPAGAGGGSVVRCSSPGLDDEPGRGGTRSRDGPGSDAVQGVRALQTAEIAEVPDYGEASGCRLPRSFEQSEHGRQVVQQKPRQGSDRIAARIPRGGRRPPAPTARDGGSRCRSPAFRAGSSRTRSARRSESPSRSARADSRCRPNARDDSGRRWPRAASGECAGSAGYGRPSRRAGAAGGGRPRPSVAVMQISRSGRASLADVAQASSLPERVGPRRAETAEHRQTMSQPARLLVRRRSGQRHHPLDHREVRRQTVDRRRVTWRAGDR